MAAGTARAALDQWSTYWSGKSVAEITPKALREFSTWLLRNGRKPSTVDRILAVGRAALNLAHRDGELASVPFVRMTESSEEKRSREPLGRPIKIPEIARFLDAVRHRHLFVFLLLELNTLARPEALFELRRNQYDATKDRLNLNPAGRRQTKKFRPVVPVTKVLKPWLESETDPERLYVTLRGNRIFSIKTVWQKTRDRAGLPSDITPYSFRHGIARALRERKVPPDQIGLILGHLPRGSFATTSIYAPLEPEYCTEAVQALEAISQEVQSLMTSGMELSAPAQVSERLLQFAAAGTKLSEADRRLLRERIRGGASTRDVAEEFRSQNLWCRGTGANLGLDEVRVLVPTACRLSEPVELNI